MNFKKCNRCGCFYIDKNSVCKNCSSKDAFEIEKLENFITNENNGFSSLTELSINTGITTKNLNRYLQNNKFSNSFKNTTI